MHDQNDTLLLWGPLATLVAFVDLVWTLRTGRARTWPGGSTVTREHQPARYLRYVYADCAALALFIGVSLWAIM
jgi:hypothetical protein